MTISDAITAEQISLDIWKATYDLVVALEADYLFTGTAFSAIVTQYPNPPSGGYLCINNQKLLGKNYMGAGRTAKMFLMQMR